LIQVQVKISRGKRPERGFRIIIGASKYILTEPFGQWYLEILRIGSSRMALFARRLS
jgi:hypothetical protein